MAFFRPNDDSPEDEDLEEEIKTMYPGFVYRVPDPQITQEPPMKVVVPILGRFRFVRDFKGVMTFGAVIVCFLYSILTTMYIIIIPRYQEGVIPGLFVWFYVWIFIMCILSLLNVSTTNPGEVTPEDSDEYANTAVSTYCKLCHLHRPPRGYHCMKCCHCVRRMDYHYIWLNNCVGEENHHLFLLFLIYTFTLCVITSTLIMLHFYRFPKCYLCDRDAIYVKHSIWLLYIQNIMSVISGFQTLISIIVQHLNIIMNRTTVENIFLSPVYDTRTRTKFQAYAELFKTKSVWLWIFPCRRKTMAVSQRRFFFDF